MASSGLLVILSGPSGTGKGTVLKSLLAGEDSIRFSVSATTRPPRPGEENGREYYFISREEFKQMVDSGEMLESAEYCGNWYGTPAAPIRAWTSQGIDVVLDIEVQGGAQVKRKCPDAVGVFILPPSLQELEHRLRNRATESDEKVRRRLETARREIPEAVHYDYVVVNDAFPLAAGRIREIMHAEKHRVRRNTQLIERMLQE